MAGNKERNVREDSVRRTNLKLNRRKGTKKKSGSGINKITIHGAAVLAVAIVLGLVLNKRNTPTTSKSVLNPDLAIDPSFADFLEIACDKNGTSSSVDPSTNKAWCGNGKIEATRRTFQASVAGTRPIRRGDTLVEVPREFQIWEIDALRSDFVESENLLKARHEQTGNPLAGGAFLAAYLAHERKRLTERSNRQQNLEMAASANASKDELRESYLQSLPSWEELSAYHPILVSQSDLKSMLTPHSLNFAVIIMYKVMVESEYKAMAIVSPKGFGQQITLEEYQVARIHVLSRSFSPGPDACKAEVEKYFRPDDLERVKSTWGMRSSKSTFEDGCHAMVPILDTLDSHPRPNVLYTYDSEKQAFVISAKSKISPQYELINSYGKYSDSHLFAKFGFVNGDGSGYTQASMALFHRPFDILMGEDFSLMPNVVMNGKDDESETQSLMDETLNHQRKEMKRYLTMDDGYDDCIQKDLHPEAFKLKRLKLMHLIRMANDPSSWIATLQPRKPRSRPRESINLLISEEPPKFNPSNVQVNLIKLMNTCRLIVLNEEDYDGRAIQILEDNLENKDFVVPEMEGNKALEYRSLKYLGRMTASALMQYTPVKMKQEFETVRQLNKENAFGNSTWTAAQLRLGEMQSLHAVSGIAMTFARKLLEGMEEEQIGVQFKIRESSCPKAYTDILDKDLN